MSGEIMDGNAHGVHFDEVAKEKSIDAVEENANKGSDSPRRGSVSLRPSFSQADRSLASIQVANRKRHV